MSQHRAIAIYLPQFHPIPENDHWWGKGFTEWSNVVKAKPLFKDHYQPHLPADLGFYDLRVPETREAQANLAREYGIYGFCYYHYWFNGKRILERPFQEVFESGKPDFPFMLCWANENWTRSWDGGNNEILLEQKHAAADDLLHIQALIPYFKDKRYIRVENKPVIAIYRSTLMPDVASTIRIWRAEAAKHGIELYICRFESFGTGGHKYLNGGFDASIDFQPLSKGMQNYVTDLIQRKTSGFISRIADVVVGRVIRYVSRPLHEKYKKSKKKKLLGRYYDYTDFINYQITSSRLDYKQFPCVFPMWDNTARRKKTAGIFHNSTPAEYKRWLIHILKNYKPYSKEENFIFINAWNEWAEGCHLEPCQRWGLQYLEATRDALQSNL